MNKKIQKIIAIFLLWVLSSVNIAWADELAAPVKNSELTTPVECSGVKSVIPKHEVITLKFAQKFNANKAVVGDKVNFTLADNILSKEDKVVLPKGTLFVGVVEKQVKSKSFNRNARVFIPIKQVQLPSGKYVDITAHVNKRKGELKSPAAGNIAKILLEAGVVVGVGVAALAVVVAATITTVLTGGLALIVLIPVVTATTAALGLVICTTSKGLNYKASAGKEIKVILQDDLELCLN